MSLPHPLLRVPWKAGEELGGLLEAPAHQQGRDAMYKGRGMKCGGQKLLSPHIPILGA